MYDLIHIPKADGELFLKKDAVTSVTIIAKEPSVTIKLVSGEEFKLSTDEWEQVREEIVGSESTGETKDFA